MSLRDAFLSSIRPGAEETAKELYRGYRDEPDHADWLNPTTPATRAPLELACSADCSTEFLDWLISEGADIRFQNDTGRDAMVGATDEGHYAKVQYLIAKGYPKPSTSLDRHIMSLCEDHLLFCIAHEDADTFAKYAAITALLLRSGF